ncbi:MAG: hypothetical protein V4787_19565 [Pseudomonadota bacterium]
MKVQTPRIPQQQEAAPPAPRQNAQTETDASEFERHMRAQEESSQAGKAPSPLTAGFGREAGLRRARDMTTGLGEHLPGNAGRMAQDPLADASAALFSRLSPEGMLEHARRPRAAGLDSATHDPSSARVQSDSRVESETPVSGEASGLRPQDAPVADLKPAGAPVGGEPASRKTETVPLHADDAQPLERERFAPIPVKTDAAESRKPEGFHRTDESIVARAAEEAPLLPRKEPGLAPDEVEDDPQAMGQGSLDMEIDAGTEIRPFARRQPGSVSEVESQLAAAQQVQAAVIAQVVRIDMVNRPESLPLEVLKAL